MQRNRTYSVAVQEDNAGDQVVTVRDLPEVVTSGSNLQEALELAADAIEVAVMGRMKDEVELDSPAPLRVGEHGVRLPVRLAAKAAVYSAWKRARLSKAELALRLDRDEDEVRRILDPRSVTKLDQLEEAARALGGHLSVTFEAAE